MGTHLESHGEIATSAGQMVYLNMTKRKKTMGKKKNTVDK